jgi:hypothetical protein
VVTLAVKQSWHALRFASKELRGCLDVVQIAACNDPKAVQFIANLRTDDRATIVEAVQKSGRVLKHLSEEFRRDREIVLLAVQRNGEVLQHAPLFAGDHDLVLAAVNSHGKALQFASEELRNSHHIALAAVSQDGEDSATPPWVS